MKNIIYFGPLTEINRLIKYISPFFQKSGFRIVLLTHNYFHKNIYEKEANYNIYCDIIDISNLSLKSIISVVSSLNASFIIITNYLSFMNYIIIKIAKVSLLKIIFLQHGIFDDKIEKLTSNNIFKSIRNYSMQLLLYYQFIFRGEKILSLTKQFYDIVYRRKLRNYYHFDFVAVYAKKDAQFILENFNIKKKQIVKTCYPIFNKNIELQDFKNKRTNENNNVLFLHQPWNFFLKNFSYEKELKYYDTIRKICLKYNYHFKIKLHPREKIDNYQIDKYKNIDIVLDNLFFWVKNSSVIIGQNTTAFYFAIILNKPIIQMFYPGYNYPSYGFDKVALKANSYKELEEILGNRILLYSKISSYYEFINENIGNNNTYEHYAEVLQYLITD